MSPRTQASTDPSASRARRLGASIARSPVLQAIRAHGTPVGAAAAARKRQLLGGDAADALAPPGGGARARTSIKFDWQHVALRMGLEVAGSASIQ